MPIGAFTKCLAGDLTQVSQNEYFSESQARKVWIKLFNQHIQLHGLPEAYVNYIERMKKAVAHYAKVANGQKWQIVKARVYEAEAKEMISQEGEKIETTCARISKFMGFPVKANECSVVEFYNYIDIMQTN